MFLIQSGSPIILICSSYTTEVLAVETAIRERGIVIVHADPEFHHPLVFNDYREYEPQELTLDDIALQLAETVKRSCVLDLASIHIELPLAETPTIYCSRSFKLHTLVFCFLFSTKIRPPPSVVFLIDFCTAPLYR